MASDTSKIRREDFLRLLRKRPFRPFWMYLKDGRVYHVRDPQMCLAGETCIQISSPEPEDHDPSCEAFVFIFYTMVDRLKIENWCETEASSSAREGRSMASDTPKALGEEIRRLLRQRPFRPFRMHLKNGQVFEVRFPDINLAGDTCIQVGIPEPNKADPFAEYWEFVFYSEIDRLEIEEQVAPAPG